MGGDLFARSPTPDPLFPILTPWCAQAITRNSPCSPFFRSQGDNIERGQFSIVPGARLFSLGKIILTRHPCESSLVFYRRKSPKINKRVHFLTKSAKKCPPPSPPYILCGPGPGRAPPGLPPGGAPVCGCAGSPSTGYNQTGPNRPVSSSNAQPGRFGYIPWTGTPPTPRRQIWKFPWPVR